MAISKITLNGEVQMDVTQDTVTANKLLYGETATGADGVGVTGNIATKTSSDMTVSGGTVTAPAGYYAAAASKSVASGSASTPATTITANPTISVSSAGLITATTSTTKSVTPTVSAGYVSSGTAGTITVSGSNTHQLTTQAAKTVTPTTSSQTAVASGRYTTGAITVAAIPSEYIVPSGTKTITENGTGIDVASYASVDVNVSGGGGSMEPCPVTVALAASSYQVMGKNVYLSYYESQDSTYIKENPMYTLLPDTPLSCYAIPRTDASLEYPYQIAFLSSYVYFQPQLNTSLSTDCTTIYSTSSDPYQLTVGCKPNAHIAINIINNN